MCWHVLVIMNIIVDVTDKNLQIINSFLFLKLCWYHKSNSTYSESEQAHGSQLLPLTQKSRGPVCVYPSDQPSCASALSQELGH